MAKKAAAIAWRAARSITAMRDQVNAFAPNRSKISDGIIGDAAHAKTKSGHNPNNSGVVVAIDLTHSPERGFDSFAFAEELRRKRDSRLAYVISNARIFSSTVSPWTWRRYTLPNPHRTHVHVEMSASAHLHDDARPWDFGLGTGDLQAVRPILRRGSVGPYVYELQMLLGIKADAVFGPITDAAVRKFQLDQRPPLRDDGVVGPITWAALNPEPPNDPDEHRDDDSRDPMATSQPLIEPEKGDADDENALRTGLGTPPVTQLPSVPPAPAPSTPPVPPTAPTPHTGLDEGPPLPRQTPPTSPPQAPTVHEHPDDEDPERREEENGGDKEVD